MAHDNLGYLFFPLGMIDKALSEYDTALKLSPEVPEIQNDIGHVYFTQGKYEKALEEYQPVLRLKPDFNAAHVSIETLYQTLEKSGRPARAWKQVNCGNNAHRENRRICLRRAEHPCQFIGLGFCLRGRYALASLSVSVGTTTEDNVEKLTGC